MILWLCFDHHATDGKVWAIRAGNTWHRVAHVITRIPMQTVYRGPKAAQPNAYLRGVGKLRTIGRTAYLVE